MAAAFLGSICLTAVIADTLKLDDVIKNIQSNQSKIKDMYAETTTVINSTISRAGSKAPQQMTQKAKMWTKGTDKSRIEVTSPVKQVTINNGEKVEMINTETGQKYVQDLKKLKAKGAPDQSIASNFDSAKKFFDLSVKPDGSNYIIVGVPKEKNKFLGKMEFTIDSSRWVPVKMSMYDPKGKLVGVSEIEYKQISGIWVPSKNISRVESPMGKMSIEMSFDKLSINQGVNDSEFKIE